MRVCILTAFFIVSFAFGSITDPCKLPDLRQPLSLEQVVKIALCNNPKTRIAWASLLYQKSLLGVSKSSSFPTVSASASTAIAQQSGNPTGSSSNINITFSYLLYDFGKRDATVQNAQYLLDAAFFSQNSTIQSVFFSTLQAYYLFFGAQASYDATKEAERFALENLNAAKTRYQIGTTTKADVLQARTVHSQAVLDSVKAKGNIENAKGDLSSSLGLSPDTNLNLIPPSLHPDMNIVGQNIRKLMAEIKKIRPDILAAGAKIEALKASEKIAATGDKPTFSITSGIGYTDSSLSSSYKNSNIGLYVKIPIFDGYATKYEKQAARQQVLIGEAEYKKLSLDASLEVYKTYQSLLTQIQAVLASQDLLESAKASYELSFGRYKAGVGTILDLLNAQSLLSSARQQYIQALYGWYIIKADFARAIGSLNFDNIKGL
ncbi:MAG: TolC family protein [Sulfurospirillaceae bacterium]|nr:TolC family protein [Sulfurospirillaceae bacterium]